MRRHGLRERELTIIPNAPRQKGDAAPWSAAHEKPRVLYAGRLSREKGVHVLVKAALATDAVELVIAGDGPLATELHELARGVERIVFTGKLDAQALSRQRAASWLSAMPSVCYENAPLAVLESFASGRPALVSGHGGLVELVEPGITGLHAPPGDVAAWTMALDGLAAARGSLEQMGQRARTRVEEEFDFERFVDRHEELYQRLAREC
jgi:glycosyltransferase involved in cell wall biosynthesis